MPTDRGTVDFILERLRSPRFSATAMFGEYALYADGKVVGLVCDNRLFAKIHPATAALEGECEQASAYPGSKPYYLVDEGQVASMRDLPEMLLKLADALPAPEPPKTKGKGTPPKAGTGKKPRRTA
jgi:DNA transformation protein and related proteins